MTIWLLADPQKAVHRLAKWSLVVSGRIVSLDRYPDSGRVISLHNDGGPKCVVWNPFGDVIPPLCKNL
jgi:hypothetical protein